MDRVRPYRQGSVCNQSLSQTRGKDRLFKKTQVLRGKKTENRHRLMTETGSVDKTKFLQTEDCMGGLSPKTVTGSAASEGVANGSRMHKS